MTSAPEAPAAAPQPNEHEPAPFPAKTREEAYEEVERTAHFVEINEA